MVYVIAHALTCVMGLNYEEITASVFIGDPRPMLALCRASTVYLVRE